MQGPGGSLVGAIGQRFPDVLVDGQIDRDLLAARVLADRDELAALECIVHPAVVEAREDFIAANADAPALLFEIPLLYETNGEAAFDKVVVVSAPTEVQRERVIRRPGMTAEKLDGLLARQLPDEQKRERADFVVDTSVSHEETREQVRMILACLGLSGAR